MQTLQEIFKHFNLKDADVKELSKEAKATAIGCGKKGVVKELLTTTWNLFDDISDEVWTSSKTILEKIELGFQLYDLFPSYWHFLRPFYYSISNNEIDDQNEKEIIWRRFMKYLSSEDYYADPVGYVLWVEFFEDESTVRETWQGLINNYSDRKSLFRLLEHAGPVPFDLKETVYNSLLVDTKSHEYILTAYYIVLTMHTGKLIRKKRSISFRSLRLMREPKVIDY